MYRSPECLRICSSGSRRHGLLFSFVAQSPLIGYLMPAVQQPMITRSVSIARCIGNVICILDVGCTTMKHVREAIAPVQDQANKTQDQLGALQKQADAHKQAIGDLDREVARASEKATDADKNATEAAEAASESEPRRG